MSVTNPSQQGLRPLFPKTTRSVRLVLEREPRIGLLSFHERNLSARCALLSLLNTPWMVAERLLKVTFAIAALAFTLVSAPFSKKIRALLPPCSIAVMDAALSIPVLVASQTLLIFKHLIGIANPHICFRLGTLKEQVILANHAKGRIKLKNKADLNAWRLFRQEEFPTIRKRFKRLVVYEKQFYPFAKIVMVLRKSREKQKPTLLLQGG